MSHGKLIYTSDDDYGKLVALLDQRRKMIKRHSRKRASRCQGTLAEKIAERAVQKEELAEINARIDSLMSATGGAA